MTALSWGSEFWSKLCLLLLVLSLGALFIAVLRNFMKKQRIRGAVHLFILLSLMAGALFTLVMFWDLNFESDTFGKDIVIPPDRELGQGIESYLVLSSSGGALEIFEQSPSYNPPFTPLALQQIGAELQAVSNSPVSKQQGFDPALLPPESLKTGAPEIHLVNGVQGGIYQVYAYVNPGEFGYVYLKVFEATRNTPLSTDTIRESSLEYTGWSSDPRQQFFYNTEIMVYEGDWGTYYPARFEVWFVPAYGGKERKLMERIFRIEGWER